MITPVTAQELPAYTLVAGGQKALRLSQILEAKYVIPMANGNLEQSGLLSAIIRSSGSEGEFSGDSIILLTIIIILRMKYICKYVCMHYVCPALYCSLVRRVSYFNTICKYVCMYLCMLSIVLFSSEISNA